MPYGEKWKQGRPLHRLSPGELSARGLQEAYKRWDLMIFRSGLSFRGTGRRPGNFPPAQFFLSPEDLPGTTRVLHEKLSQEASEIFGQAEQICRHHFDLLGYKDWAYGPRIDWHLDVVHGRRAPLKPWFKIRYLDFNEVGDHKIIWELNRHQHLVTLAKAYLLTGDGRFAAEVVQQWYDWKQSNPYPLGINWASSLEVAFRSLSWLWVRHLLIGAQDASPAFQIDLLQGLEISGRHIERYLSTYFSPNTHLLGEGVALFFIGTLCQELAAAERWKQRGWEIVLHEAERQVQPDGMHFEQSAYYHVYALDFFLHARILAACNGVPIPPAFDRTIEKMLEALMLLAQARTVPRLGDDDGGRVFNPCRNRAEHMTDPLSTGAVLFNRPDFKAAAGHLCEETLWLLGPKGAAQFDCLPTSACRTTSGRLESSGICVMASSGQREEKVVVDAGPLGYGNAGHGHADALSIEVAINGRSFLIDSGTRCYVSDGPNRNKFRGTAAHNTLQVDGVDQAEPFGPFAWRLLPRVSVERWIAGHTFDFFSGVHDGYRRLPHPVIHQRYLFYLKGQFWLVLDRAEGDGSHQLALHWHISPEIKAASAGAGNFVLAGEEGQVLALVAEHGHQWRHEIKEDEVSPSYGSSEAGLVVRYYTEAPLPVEFATLMIPSSRGISEELQAGVFSLVRQRNEGEAVSCCLCERPGEKHSVYFAGHPHRWAMGFWESDARLLYCGTSDDGSLRVALCDGSFAKWNGESILRSDSRMERWELFLGESGREEFCSDESIPREVNVGVLSGLNAMQWEMVSRRGTV